jgi:hypothetical protein
MTTADSVMERAVDLARLGAGTQEGVTELLACSGERRVALVMAKHHLQERLTEHPNETDQRAIDLLGEALSLLPDV